MFAGLERFRSNYLFLRYASQATGIVELDEAIDEARGASSGLRFVAEHLECLHRRQRFTIRSIGRQRVEDVDDPDNPGQ